MAQRSKSFDKAFALSQSQSNAGMVGFVLLIIITLAVSGPLGTYSWMNFPIRLAFWSGVIGLSFSLWQMCSEILRRLSSLSPQIRDVFAVAFVIAIMSVLVYWAQAELAQRGGADPVPLLHVTNFIGLIGAVWLVGRRALFGGFLPDKEPSIAAELDEGGEDDRPRLLRRLPVKPDARIIRISAQDHQVEVVTPSEKHMLRMRLRDAVNEMEGVDGFMTHRSHWVAKEAVQDVEDGSGGRAYVILENGDRVPLSRSMRDTVIDQNPDER